MTNSTTSSTSPDTGSGQSAPAPVATQAAAPDLSAAAAAALLSKQPASLEDLPPTWRGFVESHTSRAVNAALEKERASRPPPAAQAPPPARDAAGYVTLAQLEALLGQQAAAKQAYHAALVAAGIAPGSQTEAAMAAAYGRLVEKGQVTPAILTDPEGLKFLASNAKAAEPLPGQGLNPAFMGSRASDAVPIGVANKAKGANDSVSRDTALKAEMKDRLLAAGIAV